MAIAQPGYCPDCGKVSYASWDDAWLAAKLYDLFPHDKDGKPFKGMWPYWAHERVWHLRTMVYGHHGGGTREARNARKKRWLKRSKRKKYLSAVARMLYQLIAKGQKLNG